MNVRWLRPAIADVERLVAFAVVWQAERAPLLADRLLSAANSLASFPERGRRIDPAKNIRQLIVRVLDDRYVLEYRIEQGDVFILRVWHAREARR